jgi:hypothetical protein
VWIIVLPIRCRGETWRGKSAFTSVTTGYKETTMTAIAAAVLFGIAILMHVSGLAFGQLDSTFFMLAGLLAAALHLAGVGTHYRGRVRR